VADVEKILRLVSEGVLTPEEADEILSATAEPDIQAEFQQPDAAQSSSTRETANSRHLRIEVTENGKRVVNLRVPMNIAGWASRFLPGLTDDQTDRIRGAMSSGERGPLLDVTDDDGSRVLIVSE
jgi:SHOCT-like domain